MKKTKMTTQHVVRDFFSVLLTVISKNSSKSYGLVVLHNIQQNYARQFPFLKYVKVTQKSIAIDKKINSVNTHKVAEVLEDIIKILGPDILRMLLKEKLSEGDKNYLHKIGVKF